MSQESEIEPLSSRQNFVIACVLGVVTCANLIRRAVQMRQFITTWGWVYFGVALLATVVAAIHFVSLEKHYTYRSQQIDEAALHQLQSSIEWLYIAFNAVVFAAMHIVPFHLGR
ncbi:MAG: hypothetical protein ABSE82_14025 [Nitrososphaerales archaeon]|jgi:hypothetical protein